MDWGSTQAPTQILKAHDPLLLCGLTLVKTHSVNLHEQTFCLFSLAIFYVNGKSHPYNSTFTDVHSSVAASKE